MILNEKLKNKIKETLENDGVIAFVTDTVWGLGCLPESEKAVKKIYEIKGREKEKPLILYNESGMYNYILKDLEVKRKEGLIDTLVFSKDDI